MNRLACLITISALAAACSSNTNSQPTQDQYDDTAQQIGSTTSTGSGGGETGSMADVISLSTGGTLAGFTIGSSGTITGTHLGLTYAYSLTCKDAGGNVLATCTALTDSADAMVDWSGSLTLPNLMASVTRSGDWQISGLTGSTSSVSGTGSITLAATVDSIFRPVTTMYSLSADASYDSVQIDNQTKAVIGGDITYDVTATDTTTGQDASASTKFDINAKVTFASGGGSATLVLDGSHDYTIDTTTGVVVKASN